MATKLPPFKLMNIHNLQQSTVLIESFSFFLLFSADFHNDNEYPRLYQPEQHQNPHHDENQQINEIFIDIPSPNIRLDLCPSCSRRFASESLLKHVLICERVNTKKRRPFDSSRQRLKGTEFIVASAPIETRVSPPKTVS